MPGQPDPRNIRHGSEIPSEHYVDQPYIVQTHDGAWLCTLTTGSGLEGDTGQHVVATRSTDQGRTWSPLIDIEPPGPPESSWVMPVALPNGRTYAFYVYNAQNRRSVISDAGPIPRVDSLGEYAYKYSDDGGRTWSDDRYTISVRETAIDRANPYGGEVRFFWGVGKPIIHQGRVYFGFAKIGRFGHGFMATTEGYFLCSDNILTENDPARVHWSLLPDGDVGLRAPLGPVADEHNLIALSDGTLYCTYRTIEGHNAAAYSRDGGHSWTAPDYCRYSPGGRPLKHPRAANFVRDLGDGRYILWFHNHGGTWYEDRNPAWLCGGREVVLDTVDGPQTFLAWSEPEIVLYDADPEARLSYPDFVSKGGRYYITETQKTTARVHEVEPSLLEGLWQQHERAAIAQSGLVAEWHAHETGEPTRIDVPALPRLDQGGGLTIDLRLRLGDLAPGQIVLDSRGDDGAGLWLVTTDRGTVALHLYDGRTHNAWDCDPGLLQPGRRHHLTFVVDSGPHIITIVVDGLLCDGGIHRQFGWGRFSPHLRQPHTGGALRIASQIHGGVETVRIYDRALRTSEAVGNWRAERHTR